MKKLVWFLLIFTLAHPITSAEKKIEKSKIDNKILHELKKRVDQELTKFSKEIKSMQESKEISVDNYNFVWKLYNSLGMLLSDDLETYLNKPEEPLKDLTNSQKKKIVQLVEPFIKLAKEYSAKGLSPLEVRYNIEMPAYLIVPMNLYYPWGIHDYDDEL